MSSSSDEAESDDDEGAGAAAGEKAGGQGALARLKGWTGVPIAARDVQGTFRRLIRHRLNALKVEAGQRGMYFTARQVQVLQPALRGASIVVLYTPHSHTHSHWCCLAAVLLSSGGLASSALPTVGTWAAYGSVGRTGTAGDQSRAVGGASQRCRHPPGPPEVPGAHTAAPPCRCCWPRQQQEEQQQGHNETLADDYEFKIQRQPATRKGFRLSARSCGCACLLCVPC